MKERKKDTERKRERKKETDRKRERKRGRQREEKRERKREGKSDRPKREIAHTISTITLTGTGRAEKDARLGNLDILARLTVGRITPIDRSPVGITIEQQSRNSCQAQNIQVGDPAVFRERGVAEREREPGPPREPGRAAEVVAGPAGRGVGRRRRGAQTDRRRHGHAGQDQELAAGEELEVDGTPRAAGRHRHQVTRLGVRLPGLLGGETVSGWGLVRADRCAQPQGARGGKKTGRK